MSGIQIFNAAGALVIDSDFRGTYFSDSTNLTTITDTGYYNISCNLGNTKDMGFTANVIKFDKNLVWFKPNEGARMLACSPMLTTVNAGAIARTNSDVAIESGYRNVYDSTGRLIWSAVAAAKIPRILGFFDIPANYDLDNNVYSQNIGTNTWFLLNACAAGDLSDSGESNGTGYCGMFMRFSGGVLSCQWASKNQKSWAQTLKPYGLRVPYGILSNLS